MTYPLTEKMINRLLRDAQKLNDPDHLKKQKSFKKDKLCLKCHYNADDRCGKSKDKIKCEMFKPHKGNRPKTGNRELFNGRK